MEKDWTFEIWGQESRLHPPCTKCMRTPYAIKEDTALQMIAKAYHDATGDQARKINLVSVRDHPSWEEAREENKRKLAELYAKMGKE